jgi:DNA replication protein DnaC
MSARTKKTRAKIDPEALSASLAMLRLQTKAPALEALVAEVPPDHHASLKHLIVRLAQIERSERDARNLERRIRQACIPKFTTLDQFDWNHPRAIDRGTYNALLGLDFVGEKYNVLLRGPSGVGKSTLAANLAWVAVQAGYKVRFTGLAAALADLLRQESLPAFERRKRRYSSPDLLVLDELGYVPCDARSADILYAIIASRHETAATVVTTNLSFKQWPDVFPGAACVGALVDRFVQNCHVIDIDADSWRRKIAAQRQKAARSSAKRATGRGRSS